MNPILSDRAKEAFTYLSFEIYLGYDEFLQKFNNFSIIFFRIAMTYIGWNHLQPPNQNFHQSEQNQQPGLLLENQQI